jgi:hypothetical protein
LASGKLAAFSVDILWLQNELVVRECQNFRMFLVFGLFYSDPTQVSCQAGCLYTKHLQGEAEEWYESATAQKSIEDESQPYVIGLAGSFVFSASGSRCINVDSIGYD